MAMMFAGFPGLRSNILPPSSSGRFGEPASLNAMPGALPIASGQGSSQFPGPGGGITSPWSTPPFRPDTALTPTLPSLDAMGVQAPAVDAAPAHHGFFSRDGLGVTLLGSLGDAIGQANGIAPTFGPMMQQRRQQQFAMQQMNAQQDAEMRRQIAVASYKAAHPEPTELQQQYEWIKSTQGEQAATNFINSKTTSPPIVQHNEDGTLSVYPAGMVPRTAPTPQPAPAGVTFTPLPAQGGGVTTTSAPFRAGAGRRGR